MPTDVFNNPSNDYVKPGLPPCSNSADDYTFEFLNGQKAGIVNGAQIIQSMDLSDIAVAVTAWTSETKTLGAGEVAYIPGLTKGLLQRYQQYNYSDVLPITRLNSNDPTMFMMLDLSVNYFSNFRYINTTISASSNYILGMGIAPSLNIAFSSVTYPLLATASTDLEDFSFLGNNAGYEFNITGTPTLTLIDASMDSNSPFAPTIDVCTGQRIPQVYTLPENLGASIPSIKYPNGAMLGYIMKGYFPETTLSNDRWFYMNHVKSPVDIYEAVDVSIFSSFEIVESSVYYIPAADISLFVSAATWEASTFYTDPSALNPIDVSVFLTNAVWDSSSFGSNSFDVSIFISPAVWNASTYYNSLGNPVDVSVFISPAFWLPETYESRVVVTTDVSVLISPSVADSAMYYNKYSKRVEVGQSVVCSGDTSIMGASEYLDYVDTLGLWDKVGDIRCHITAFDPDSSTGKNLLTGFYLYNPHDFTVKVEYMIIN